MTPHVYSGRLTASTPLSVVRYSHRSSDFVLRTHAPTSQVHAYRKRAIEGGDLWLPPWCEETVDEVAPGAHHRDDLERMLTATWCPGCNYRRAVG